MTEMHGAISLMPMPDLAHIAGARMVSPASVITTNAFASDFPFGTARILSSRNAFLALPATRETTAKM